MVDNFKRNLNKCITKLLLKLPFERRDRLNKPLTSFVHMTKVEKVIN